MTENGSPVVPSGEQERGLSVLQQALAQIDRQAYPEGALHVAQGPNTAAYQTIYLRVAERLFQSFKETDGFNDVNADVALAFMVNNFTTLNEVQMEQVARIRVNNDAWAKVEQVRQLRDQILDNFSANLAANSEQVIPEGVLLAPPFRQQESDLTCVGAVFLSAFEGITGIRLEEEPFIALADSAGLMTEDRTVSYDVFAAFMTDAFQEAFPDIHVHIERYIGMDPKFLRLALKAKRLPISSGKIRYGDVQYLCFPDLGLREGMHHAIGLMSVGERVPVVDPLRSSQGYSMDREEYFRMIGRGRQSGILIGFTRS